jgi:D-sedoheptulose 7-phosphate isomerase
MSMIGSYFDNLIQTIQRCDQGQWNGAIDLIDSAWQADSQIIVFGNGGSALAAQHAITDWNKSLFMASNRPFRGVSLADNMGIFSAYANDVRYEDVFLEQLRPVLRPGDLVLAISGSGNSENIVRALVFAKSRGANIICLTGYDGGRIHSLADCNVHVPIDDMQIAEDLHLVFIHVALRELMIRGRRRSAG